LRVTLIRHEEYQSGCQAYHERYHKQDDECLDHAESLFCARIETVGAGEEC